MSGARVPLDLVSPLIVASQALVWRSRRFVRGDSFPWRDLGVSELELLQLYSCFKVDCVALLSADTLTGERRAIKLDDDRTIVVKAGERVRVETPQQRAARSKRR